MARRPWTPAAVIETTLALRTYAVKIPAWRLAGYRIALIYLRLATVENSIARVQHRVRNKGHDIPEQTIRRRFPQSLRNLDKIYKPIVDEWYIWDSVDGDFNPAEAGSGPVRYHEAVVGSDTIAYIEQNPVRAGLTHSADQYPWSSATSAKVGQQFPPVTSLPQRQAEAPALPSPSVRD